MLLEWAKGVSVCRINFVLCGRMSDGWSVYGLRRWQGVGENMWGEGWGFVGVIRWLRVGGGRCISLLGPVDQLQQD